MGIVTTETSSPAAPAVAPAAQEAASSETAPEVNASSTPPGEASPASDAASGEAAKPEPTPPAAEPEQTAEQERTAKRVAAAVAAERRVRTAELKAKEALSTAEKRAADLEARERDLKAKEAQIAEAFEDPIAWALANGKDPDELAKRFLKPVTAEQRKLREIEERIKADEERRKKEEADGKTKAEKARAFEEARRFVGSITPDDHPYITTVWSPQQTANMRDWAIREHGPSFREEHGRAPTDAEIRTFLEDYARAEFEDGEKRRTALREKLSKQASSTPSNGTPPPQASQGNGHRATNGPGTLTNTHAAQATTGKPPPPKTKEERKRALIEQLEAEAREGART